MIWYLILYFNLNMKRATVSQHRDRDHSRHSQSIDMDPYSTSIIEELLASSEWRDQNEIIPLTFRALTDIIQVHTDSIKDLKSLITTRASKQELTATMSLKANVSDFAKMFEEMSSAMDSKVSISDVSALLKDYAQKKDLNEFLLMSSQSQSKSDRNRRDDKQFELKVLQARVDDFQKEIGRRLGTCVTLPEFQELLSIVEQKVNIGELNEVLENRVTKQYLATCLQKKVSKSELDGLVAKKADVSDLDYIVSSLEMKASLPTIEKLTQIIQNKADRSDLLVLSHEKKSFNEQVQAKIQQMRKQIDRFSYESKKDLQQAKSLIEESIKMLERENEGTLRNLVSSSELNIATNQLRKEIGEEIRDLKKQVEGIEKDKPNLLKYDSFKRELTNELNLRKRCEEKIYEEIDDVRKRIEQVAGSVLQKTEFFNFKSELAEQLDQKIETEHVQEAFNKWEVEISQKMEQDKQEFYAALQRVQKPLTEAITKNSAEILNIAANHSRKPEKIDHSMTEEIIRKNRRQIEDFRRTIDTCYNQLRGKIDVAEYEADLLEIRKKFDHVQRDLGLKAYIKDVCVLADSKPNIEDVNKALKQIKTALDSKTSEQDLQDVVKDQSTINETLLCQNIIGRWLWQSGEVKPGGLIPWEVEFANTVPDYYFWDKDKSSILILVSGIYEISVSIFGRNSYPALMINGETIGSRQEENTNTMNQMKRTSSTTTKRRKDKDYVGHKIQQFVTLPARSRISVCVPLEGGEGLLNIRRL